MDRIIYIDPRTQAGLKVASKLSNFEVFLRHLDPIDFSFILYSSLYQSGANYFEIDYSLVPDLLKNNPFWKEKFISIDKEIYQSSENRAIKILESNFNFDLDRTYRAPQAYSLKEYFTSLFYCTQTGVPFINVEFAESRNFDFLESRFNKEFFFILKNFHSLINLDNISTVTPQYTVLKRDVRRFEDIANSTLFLRYADSLNLLKEEDKIDLIKRDIHSNAVKVYNKYAKYLNLNGMTFGFMKASNRLMELFVNKQASVFGDFFVDIIEKINSRKRIVNYYKVEEAHFMILWANRIGEMMQNGGKESLTEFLEEYKKNHTKE